MQMKCIIYLLFFFSGLKGLKKNQLKKENSNIKKLKLNKRKKAKK